MSIDSTEFGAVRVNAGDDKVSVTAGSTVTGGPGIDHITGSDHTDFPEQSPEDDTLLGGGAFDSLLGEDGNDRLLDTSPDGNCLSGNDGNDQIIDGPGADFLNGDEAFCGADTAPDPKEDGGFPGNDGVIITGGGSDVVVAGNSGKDEVKLDKAAVYEPSPTRAGRVCPCPGQRRRRQHPHRQRRRLRPRRVRRELRRVGQRPATLSRSATEGRHGVRRPRQGQVVHR